MKALQDTVPSVAGSLAVAATVSATGAVKGNTLQLAEALADTRNTANAGRSSAWANAFPSAARNAVG